MTLTLRNNIKPDIIRRLFIGLLLGVAVVGVWSSFFASHDPDFISDMQFDREIIPLPQQEITHNDKIPSPPSTNDNNEEELPLPKTVEGNDRFYPFFATFRAPLTSAQQVAVDSGKPLLSIILSNAGASRTMNDMILDKLSNNVTLSLSPYLHNHNVVASRFSEYGFEIWMDLAAITYEMNHDHGELALNPVNNFENNIAKLATQLDNKDKVTGLVLPPQSLIIETQSLWSDIVSDLFAEGYGVLDNTAQVMKPSLFFHDDRRAPYIKGDQNFNAEMTTTEFKNALSNLRKNVQDQGRMIVTIPVPTPAILDILADWIDSLEDEGITLVPVSAQAKL